MTRTRERILAYIIEYKAAHDGVSPTYDEIMQGVGVNSKSVISHHIGILVETGYLRRVIGSPRSLEVVKRTGGGDTET
jgi:SOS-response transcriptional repressor LexA